jgi:enamine deaminase RidA (YjgF/YER057c/UK114 family)
MLTTAYPWLGTEFVSISGEARPGQSADQALAALLDGFATELSSWGLSLDNTVRTRLWGRDREARDLGSKERVARLAGGARSASSSFICPAHFDSEANVALDLWAMRPSQPGARKLVQEYEPPIAPPRYIVYENAVVLSGVTWEHDDLEAQLGNILPRIGGSLTDAGTSWAKVTRMSCLLHRSQTLEDLESRLAKHLGGDLPADRECSLVDGYSSLGKLIEIEVTATL